MLAKKRQVIVGGVKATNTPLLIPSFSSKGFPQVSEIVRASSESITDHALISAYDVYYKLLKDAPLTFPALWFLDSGGFECGNAEELSELHYSTHLPKEWDLEKLSVVLDEWAQTQPTIAISYDNPNRRIPLEQQITEAKALFEGRPFGREFLIKPETPASQRVDSDLVIKHIDKLAAFDVLGFTEKELGFSLHTRVKNISKIRKALVDAGLDIPIHVFGSLDMVSTPLYFLAGADIFDGLTWLRFAYHEGRAIYMRDLAAMGRNGFGSRINDIDVRARVLGGNLEEIWNLSFAMKEFLRSGQFSVFKHHSTFFEQTLKEAQIDIEGVV